MPPFEGPKPKLSVGERAAAQNKKGAAEQSKKILQGLIAGINKRYKNDRFIQGGDRWSLHNIHS